ncbi:MAG: SRPBCC family protein [Cyclobacteriaceae bacterium]
MKILKIVVVVLLAIVGVVLLVGLLAPREVQMERSITINASAESIFEEVEGMKSFNAWSPWQKIDPEGTVYQYEGPETGKGSKMSWESEHPDVGSGNQEIVEITENSKVRTKLYFSGFDEPSYANIDIKPNGESSEVTWTFEGDMGSNPIGKIFGLFMDSMLGPQYEDGLKNLKKLVESKPTFSVDVGIEEAAPITYLGITSEFDVTKPEEIGGQMGIVYERLMTHMGVNGIEMAGMPMSVYKSVSEISWVADIAIPVSESVTEGNDDIFVASTTGGKTVKAVHKGDYFLLDATHLEVEKYMKYKGLTNSGHAYEVYVTDPSTEPDTANWVTNVYYPVN